jgi:ubiquinol-cytochrome c reductase cytochrome c subunit
MRTPQRAAQASGGIRAQLILPVVVTAVVTGGLLLLGRSAGHAQGPTSVTISTAGATLVPPAIASGHLQYELDCAWCHGGRGEGTANGPTLVGVGAASADFMLRTGRMPITGVERQPQRAEPRYTDRQIADLVDYVSSLGSGPSIPSVDPASGDLAQGAALYQIHCAACHSSTGIGGALTNGLQAPGLQAATPVEVAEAVRLGGAGLRSGNMPRFGPEVLTGDQLNAVTRYVQYLQRPEDRGGQSLGHIGPIAEGFLAWAGALLPLLVFVRWVGKRTVE